MRVMRSFKGVWLLAAVGLALAVTVVLRKTSVHTSSQDRGKSVEQWVAQLDPEVGQEARREQATSELARMQADALPDLERLLARRRNRSLDRLRGYAYRLGLAQPPILSLEDWQSRACEASFQLAERANVDISGLVPHFRFHLTNGMYADSPASRALGNSGPAGVAVLTNLLATGNLNVRQQAGYGLHFNNKSPEAIAGLIRSATSDPVPQVRAVALLYLRGSRAPAEQVVPLALNFLLSPDGLDRWLAARLLGDYVKLDEVRAALEKVRDDPDSRVRDAAARALKP